MVVSIICDLNMEKMWLWFCSYFVALTLEVTGDVVLDLVVARRAEEQSPVHQRKLFEHRQRPVAQRAVDHVPLARAEGRQDEPAGTGHIISLLRCI